MVQNLDVSYSKDFVNWSNPVEIYVSINNGTKSSTPFILFTDNNQQIVSFQTYEEPYDFCYLGDKYSTMKDMISKHWISIEMINNYKFYALFSNNTFIICFYNSIVICFINLL